MITLEQWKKNFLDKDTCPWRGPKPMEPGDDDLLIGRGDDRDRFAHEVLTHQLVILHGESGVGKSSLLNVGLVRDLTERGFQPIVCRSWTRDEASPDRPEDFVAAKVANELRSLGIDVDDAAPQSMVEQLNENYGELAVLVLDQFEELIRHQRLFFKRAMDWVVELNSRYDIHVVISLRSEYVHRLKSLNARIRPFSMSTFELEPLTATDHIRDIIASGNPGQLGNSASLREDADGTPRSEANAVGLSISLEAIELLLGEWNKTQEAEFRSAVGLLHLQGALYALHARAKPGPIKAEHVRQIVSAAAQRQRDVFAVGLIESVSRKLDLCEEACRDQDQASSLDEFLIVGTRAVVRRTVAHLSSGGFKLDREAWDLAKLALERELRILKEIKAEAAERAFRRIYGLNSAVSPASSGVVDLLNVPRADVAARAGMRAPTDTPQASPLAELGIAVSPWEVDPEGLSAGPMFGYPAHEVVIEELRRFAFALEWLTTSSLIRPTSPAVDSTMLSLIHDGFGEALENWAESEHAGPAEALVLLTGAQGDVFDWIRDDGENYWLQFDGVERDRTIVNLRWRNCRVTARFRHIVFANCDFRGTRFESCRFEGAVFVNCLLDGATFGDCDFVGPVGAVAAAYDTEGMPSFALTGLDTPTRAALSHYRGEDFSTPTLYSVTSGIAVTNRAASRSKLLEWAPQRGGLTMYGGRLSSLMVRGGRFLDGGELALRHIAGSSLDITEQDAAKIQIFGASIRGLSISRRVGDSGAQQGDIELTVLSSVLANTWLDEGLTGTARFDNSVVWQLLNVSERSRYRVKLENCTRYGAVNIENTANTGPQADFSEDGIANRPEVVHQAQLMAYRREPAMVELDEMRGQ